MPVQSDPIKRLFESAQDIHPSQGLSIPRQDAIEKQRSGLRQNGSQPDNMLDISALTLDAENPIRRRQYDTLFELEDIEQIIAETEKDAQFPARITGRVSYSVGLYRYSWEEVEWNSSTQSWDTLVNGRNSTYGGSDFGKPAYSSLEVDGVTEEDNPGVTSGQVFEMHEVKTPGYVLYWFEGDSTIPPVESQLTEVEVCISVYFDSAAKQLRKVTRLVKVLDDPGTNTDTLVLQYNDCEEL